MSSSKPREAGPVDGGLARSGQRKPLEALERSASLAPADPPDRFVLAEGPVGGLFVAWSAEGICHVALADPLGADPVRFALVHEQRLGRPAAPANRQPEDLSSALRDGHGERLRYDLRGCSAFAKAVLSATLRIPPGEVRTYAELAAAIGRPGAARAVGRALGRNPVPVLLPCHRVVAADGGLGGYALGVQVKRRLLEAEGALR